MLKKILAASFLLLAAVLGFHTTTLGAFQIGIEEQLNNECTIGTAKVNWWLTDNWALRGDYSWNTNDFGIAALYKFNPRAETTLYMGLKEDDLSGNDPRLSVAQKAALVVGVEWDMSRIKSGLSLMIEAQINPNDILKYSSVNNGPASSLGLSLNYRFPMANIVEQMNDKDSFSLLSRLITLEAPDEPFEGQVAVAAVVLNRIRSADFPDSVRDVVYQQGQFKTARKLTETVPGESAIKAAKIALRGNDPSHGALYFYNPATCSPKARQYIQKAHFQVTARIGRHVFLK